MQITLLKNELDPLRLYEMFRSAMEPYVNAARGVPWDEARERGQFLTQLLPECVRLIEWSKQRVGFVDFRNEADGWLLHTLVILPAWQSRGAGSAVLDLLMTQCNQIKLSVLKVNPRARRFYQRKGFHEVSCSQYHVRMKWEG